MCVCVCVHVYVQPVMCSLFVMLRSVLHALSVSPLYVCVYVYVCVCVYVCAACLACVPAELSVPLPPVTSRLALICGTSTCHMVVKGCSFFSLISLGPGCGSGV